MRAAHEPTPQHRSSHPFELFRWILESRRAHRARGRGRGRGAGPYRPRHRRRPRRGAARGQRAELKTGAGRRDLGRLAFAGNSCAGPLDRSRLTRAARRAARPGGAATACACARSARASKNCGFQARSCWPPWREIPDCRRALTWRRPWWPVGMSDTHEAAFRKYLSKGKAAHIAAEWPALETVVGWIRAAGGVASLAHPARYALSAGARRHLLADFTAAGGTVARSGDGRQRRSARRYLRGARREARSIRIGGFGFSQPASCLESPGPLP